MMFGSFIIFIIFLILLFGGTFAYIFFYDMAWDRSIAKVGKYKIKYEGGFFVAYVYNYFHDYDTCKTGFHYERIGENYTWRDAEAMAQSASETIKKYFLEWSETHRVV